MKVLLVALCMILAFVKGHDGNKKQEWFANIQKQIQKIPCYPLMKKFLEAEADCEGFTSALVTDEEIREIMKDEFPDKCKEKGGKGCGETDNKQLCAMEKLGLVNEETKSLDLEKFAPIIDLLTDDTVKKELTNALAQCVKAEYTSEAICATKKQKELLAKFRVG